MNNDFLISLLTIVSVNGNISPLIKKGYTHSQIAMLFQEAIECKYIEMKDNIIQLTDQGTEYLQKYYKRCHLKGSKQWITHQDEYRVIKIKKYDIMFPKKI